MGLGAKPSPYSPELAVSECSQLSEGLGAKLWIENLLKTVGLENVSDKKGAGQYSLGMRQRLGIALALIGDPSMIILDEPINGLDPQGIVEVRHTLERLRDEKGITIMISSHILAELGKIADSYGIIHEGKLLDQFTSEELEHRCSRFITIKTNDNAAAQNALSKIGIANMSVTDEGLLRVEDAIERSPEMARAIVNAGLELHDLHSTNVSLEDYYLRASLKTHLVKEKTDRCGRCKENPRSSADALQEGSTQHMPCIAVFS